MSSYMFITLESYRANSFTLCNTASLIREVVYYSMGGLPLSSIARDPNLRDLFLNDRNDHSRIRYLERSA